MNEDTTTIRRDILKMMHYSKSSHIGGALSIVEILYELYFHVMNIDPLAPSRKDRDIFILSKGHCSAALYATLALRGYFPRSWLDRYYIDDGLLPGHLDMSAVPGIECSAGSLGHGLSIGLGMALARQRRGESSRVFVLLGDGECNEGSVWEAVMLAGSQKVTNLTAIVDFNHLQGMARDILDQTNLAQRFLDFGWDSLEIDGHDQGVLRSALEHRDSHPTAIIAQTTKGKGVSFMEDRLEWHYKSPNDEQYKAAIAELGRS